MPACGPCEVVNCENHYNQPQFHGKVYDTSLGVVICRWSLREIEGRRRSRGRSSEEGRRRSRGWSSEEGRGRSREEGRSRWGSSEEGRRRRSSRNTITTGKGGAVGTSSLESQHTVLTERPPACWRSSSGSLGQPAPPLAPPRRTSLDGGRSQSRDNQGQGLQMSLD